MSDKLLASETQPIRVLLIEDDAAQARLLEHLIRRSPRPFDIVWADRLSVALGKIEEGGFDVTIVDLGLPDSQGLATFDAVRAADPFLPAVVMTGTDCEQLATEAVRRGAQDYIVKGHHSGPTIARSLCYAVERQRLEEQLRQSQKMEAVGALAGGVAHEFNNLLQAIIGYTRYAMEGLPNQDMRHRDLAKAIDAAERAAGLTRQLLNFSRRDDPMRRDVNVAELVADVADLVAPLLADKWHLELRLPSDVLTLHADPGMLQQALMNLCINARDAMPDGGTLTIEARGAMLAAGSNHLQSGANPGEYVVLSVQDEGCGIPPELRERVLEPFFTTKQLGKGTGLGLAMIYSITSQHGGHLKIDSEENAGSTFAIFLPKNRREASSEELANNGAELAIDALLTVDGSSALASQLLLPQAH